MAIRTQTSRPLAVATVLGGDALILKSMTAVEELGRLYSIDLVLLSSDPDVVFDKLLGSNITVRLEIGDQKTRYWNGLVSRFVETSRGGGLVEYHARLVPWLWFLTRAADCRIFQDKTVLDIIKQVFRDHGVSDFDDKLTATYRTRNYCVQYRETDFNFVSRLMEEEGIYYHFRHENGKHTLVLVDAPSAHDVFPGYAEIPYKPPDKVLTDREFITDWSFQQVVQPVTFAHTDFDFQNPKNLLETKSKIARAHPLAYAEYFDYPGGFEKTADGDAYARRRIEEFHARFEVASARTDSRGVCVGSRFKLLGWRRKDQCKDYLVVSSVTNAASDEFESRRPGAEIGVSLAVSFGAMDAKAQFRPQRVTPKPLVHGAQTAIVVGKAGEEVFTDEFGRVKVLFHWDRDSSADEKSSCWVRVAQVWAGKQWGSMHIPRIGQEVIVDFLEGDPDRPIITGRVYNAENKPPYNPAAAPNGTITTIKSNSSKGGGGFNEIRFQDEKGEEQVFIHGQKDGHLRVNNEVREWVGKDRHLWVVNDQFETIKNDRHETVENDHFEKIVRDRNLLVEGKEAKHVKKSLSLTVTESVAEVFNKDQSTIVTGDLYIQAKNVVIEGGTNITLKVGTTSIAIEENGVSITTNGSVKVDAKLAVELASSGAAFKAKGLTASVEGTTEAKLEGAAMAVVKGGIVKIN